LLSKVLKNHEILTNRNDQSPQVILQHRQPVLKAKQILDGGTAQVSLTDIILNSNRDKLRAKRRNLPLQVYTRMEVESILDEEAVQFEKQLLSNIEEIRMKGIQERRTRGFEEGRKEGYENGCLKAHETIKQLESFMASIEAGWEKMHRSSEQQIIKAACTLANLIVFDSEFLRPSVIIDALNNSSSLLTGEKALKITLNPAERQSVENVVADIFSKFAKAEQIKINSDENIKPGGCLIETELGKIDATVEARWKMLVKQVLGG